MAVLKSTIEEQDWKRLADRLDLSPLAGRTFLLTGATGLIGRYVAGTIAFANRRSGLGCRLVCTAHSRTDPAFGADSLVEWVKVDLSQPFRLEGRFDYIFHAACYAQPKLWFGNRAALIDLNVNATRALLDVARESSGTFFFCSSAEVYGDPPASAIPIAEAYIGGPAPEAQRAVYGSSKRLGEVLCTLYREDGGVRSYAARISHLYGPGIGLDDQRVFADFMRQALAGQPIRLRDQGGAIKTLGYIADAVFMMFKIFLGGQQMIYNVGGVDQVSIRGLADRIAALAGGVEVIAPVMKAGERHIGSDAGITALDIRRFSAEFGVPAFTDLDVGLGRMIAWNQERELVKLELQQST